MGRKPLDIAVLEPYYGGSHKAFIDVFAAHTRHRITLATLPARKWKWRMRGAAMWFAKEDTSWMVAGETDSIDLIFCSDMLSVADLRALLPDEMNRIPILCYFHENQLTYPLPEEQSRDYQYGMTNITSCLAADALWFNSRFHLEDFLSAAGTLLNKMPDYVPSGAILEIRDKAQVWSPPVSIGVSQKPGGGARNGRTILWCHRWEFDKDPVPFFEALLRLDAKGHAFDLVLLGEQFRTAPPVFADSWDRLQHHIVHAGFVPDRADYVRQLQRCDLVVSTAIQENFGIGVIEAILAGCQPLLPQRLAYPEVIPERYHGRCLYADDNSLFGALDEWARGQRRLTASEQANLMAELESSYGAAAQVERMDDALEQISAGRRPSVEE